MSEKVQLVRINGKYQIGSTEQLRHALKLGHGPDAMEIGPSAEQVREKLDALARHHLADQAKAHAFQQVRVEERTRIAQLQAITRPGFDRLLAEAIQSGSSPGEYALALMTEAADRGVTLDSMRANSPPVIPHAAAPDDDHGPVGASWANITGCM